jgi:acyl dehydratase
MGGLCFEDVEVGDSYTAGPYRVTKSEIVRFAQQYDPVPEKIDEEAAARSIFRGLTACSPHIFSVYILLTSQLQPRLHFLGGLGWDELRMPNAVRPDDELDLDLIVLEKRESRSKSDRGILRLRIILRNQRRETALECLVAVLIARRPNAPTDIERTDSR